MAFEAQWIKVFGKEQIVSDRKTVKRGCHRKRRCLLFVMRYVGALSLKEPLKLGADLISDPIELALRGSPDLEWQHPGKNVDRARRCGGCYLGVFKPELQRRLRNRRPNSNGQCL